MEDMYAIAENLNNGRAMYVVCDGMGSGFYDGKATAELICKRFIEFFREHPDMEINPDMLVAAKGAIEHDMALYAYNNSCHLGSTMVLVVLDSSAEKVHIAHLGDCRAYHIDSSGEILFKTTDHSIWTPGGFVPSKYFKAPAMQNERWSLTIETRDIKHGGIILLATDGVTEFCTDARIEDAAKKMLHRNIPITDTILEHVNVVSDDNHTLLAIKIE